MPIIGPTTDHFEIQHWADSKGAVPTEILPGIVDGEPAQIRLVLKYSSQTHPERRQISWIEFFSKFDQLGLAFVYDDSGTGYNELLQIEARSPYRNEQYRAVPVEN
jgi:hypothetical protein